MIRDCAGKCECGQKKVDLDIQFRKFCPSKLFISTWMTVNSATSGRNRDHHHHHCCSATVFKPTKQCIYSEFFILMSCLHSLI